MQTLDDRFTVADTVCTSGADEGAVGLLVRVQ